MLIIPFLQIQIEANSLKVMWSMPTKLRNAKHYIREIVAEVDKGQKIMLILLSLSLNFYIFTGS